VTVLQRGDESVPHRKNTDPDRLCLAGREETIRVRKVKTLALPESKTNLSTETKVRRNGERFAGVPYEQCGGHHASALRR